MPYPQPYVLDLRNGGVPAVGFALQLNAGVYQSPLNASGSAVTTNLPTWAESTLIPGMYVCTYDALTYGPLIFGVSLTGLSDAGDYTVRLAMLADPAAIASTNAAIANAQTLDIAGAFATVGLTPSTPALSTASAEWRQVFTWSGQSLSYDPSTHIETRTDPVTQTQYRARLSQSAGVTTRRTPL